ncbi:hypothetical protein PT974_04794 [Cladobotryum mycophilum]|uniref:Uncharacterized protein n=1 Tax=Cladobotryum mycophilum TaxID=491253 RepID=A0ABR0SRC2_9HYPO
MRFKSHLAAGLAVANASAVYADDILQVSLPLEKLLHVSPPLSSGSISMYPGRHPTHDGADLDFLVPRLSREMYFAQEGHRKAIHGSKHAQLKAIFKYPTVILDQSDHLKSIKCNDYSIEVCFRNLEARNAVEKSWAENTHSGTFHLITYHRGCGDLTGHKRSYFLASQPVRNSDTDCVVVPTKPINEQDAFESGEFSWGIYEDPEERRRAASVARGHIRALSAGDYSGMELSPDETVDIDDDLAAADEFFNTTAIDPYDSGPDDPIEFVEEDGTVEKRGCPMASRGFTIRARSVDSMSSKVYQGLVAAFKVAKRWIKGKINLVHNIMDYAGYNTEGFYETFKSTIPHSFHHDYHVDNFISTDSNGIGSLVLGEAGYLVYQNKGKGSKRPGGDPGGGKDQESSKGALRSHASNFAFDALTGIKSGRLVVDTTTDTKVYAHIGIMIGGSYPIDKYQKQIAATPFSPITVPGLFTIGPELSISASLNFDLSGEAELIVGGNVTLSPGRAILDLKEKTGCRIESGLVPSFDPVARASGRIEVVAALGLPIALEIGVDILNGQFKSTVGLVNTPSAYISAGISVGAGSPCDDGIELRLGARNKIEISAFDHWSLVVHDLTLYDHGLGCVSRSGFDKDKVQPDKSPIFEYAKKKLAGDGDLYVDIPTPLRNLASHLGSLKRPRYWSVIMDKEETSILVSGKDGYIYLAKPGEQNELTEAWGTVEPSSGLYAFDTLGRVLSYDKAEYKKTDTFMATMRVSHTTKVLINNVLGIMVALQYHSESPSGPLVMFLAGVRHVRYPTFCKISGQGLRLYATQYVVHEDGKVLDDEGDEYEGADDIFAQLGLNKTDCRTMNLLVSGFK